MEENVYIEAFSKRLYTLRQKKGVSARDMSLSLGQAHNYINGLEAGKSFPLMLNFFYICEYLDVTPQEFFDYNNGDPEKSNELYSEIKKLESNSQEYFLGLIKDVNNRPT